MGLNPTILRQVCNFSTPSIPPRIPAAPRRPYRESGLVQGVLLDARRKRRAMGVYDPANYNDRLLLGLKGTMSEAELHILQARMLAGRNAKARRGELGKPLPMGYLRRAAGEAALDPGEQAQGVIRLVFDLFERLRTVSGVLRYLVENDIKMPVRQRGGLREGELEWRRSSRLSLGDLFSNPIYAGVYVYGVRPIDRRRHKPGHPSSGRRPPRPENAEVFLPDRLPAYITWEQFQRNQQQIRANRTSEGGPVRAGAALLSGLIVCGRCGLRMMATYNNAGHAARCQCNGAHTSWDAPYCQALKAAPVDAEVTHLILKALEPAAIEASLAAALDLEAERKALDQHWRQRLERAQHQVDLARRRYASVESENRPVARTLEKDWEAALGEQARLIADHQRFLHERPEAPIPAELAAIQDLTRDLPALWRAETTTRQERQTIARLLLERVKSHRDRRQRAGPPGVRLAGRQPNLASTGAARRQAEGAQRLSGSGRPGRRTSSGRPQLRRDRGDPQRRALAAAQASRYLQRPDGATRLDRRGTDRDQARDPGDRPSPSPGRTDDQRTRRRNRRAPGHDIPLGPERAANRPLGRSARDLQQARDHGRFHVRPTQSRPSNTPAIPSRPASQR